MTAHSDTQMGASAKQGRPWIKRPQESRRADAELAAAAVDAIDVLTTVSHESIKITAHNGWLRLEGTVAGRHQRIVLDEITRNLPGVQGVVDSTIVQRTLC